MASPISLGLDGKERHNDKMIALHELHTGIIIKKQSHLVNPFVSVYDTKENQKVKCKIQK